MLTTGVAHEKRPGGGSDTPCHPVQSPQSRRYSPRFMQRPGRRIKFGAGRLTPGPNSPQSYSRADLAFSEMPLPDTHPSLEKDKAYSKPISGIKRSKGRERGRV